MFRSLLIIIFVALVLWAIRSLMVRASNKTPAAKPENKNMVQCLQCKTYIPSEDAIIKGEQCFCCTQHQEDWNKTA